MAVFWDIAAAENRKISIATNDELTAAVPIGILCRSFLGGFSSSLPESTAPSSRGPGHRPFTAATGVRIPSGSVRVLVGYRTTQNRSVNPGDFALCGKTIVWTATSICHWRASRLWRESGNPSTKQRMIGSENFRQCLPESHLGCKMFGRCLWRQRHRASHGRERVGGEVVAHPVVRSEPVIRYGRAGHPTPSIAARAPSVRRLRVSRVAP